MKIIVNDIIPLNGFKAMTIWPFIFARKDLSVVDVRHETIHGLQQKEMMWCCLILGFLLLYGLMWLVELVRCLGDKSRGSRADGKHRSVWKRAYKMIPYEREAFYGENVEGYVKKRKPFNFIHFIKD